jgi:hypothetical protein
MLVQLPNGVWVNHDIVASIEVEGLDIHINSVNGLLTLITAPSSEEMIALIIKIVKILNRGPETYEEWKQRRRTDYDIYRGRTSG